MPDLRCDVEVLPENLLRKIDERAEKSGAEKQIEIFQLYRAHPRDWHYNDRDFVLCVVCSKLNS
jgi:hypothetical protein